MKTSLRIFGILLIGLFAISVVGCERTEEQPPVVETVETSQSYEEKLAGQYEVIRLEYNYDGEIDAYEPPAVNGSMILVNGGRASIDIRYEDGYSQTEAAEAWSATATIITFAYDYGHVSFDYTLQGDVLTMTYDNSDDETIDSGKHTWKKK